MKIQENTLFSNICLHICTKLNLNINLQGRQRNIIHFSRCQIVLFTSKGIDRGTRFVCKEG